MNQITSTTRDKQDRPAGPPQPEIRATLARATRAVPLAAWQTIQRHRLAVNLIIPGGGRRRMPELVGRPEGFVKARFAGRVALCALVAAGALMAGSAPSRAATAPAQAASSQRSGVVGSISDDTVICVDSAKSTDSSGQRFWYNQVIVPAPDFYAVDVPGVAGVIGPNHIQPVSFRADLWRYEAGVWTKVASSRTYYTKVADPHSDGPHPNVMYPYWIDGTTNRLVDLSHGVAIWNTSHRGAYYQVYYRFDWYPDKQVSQRGWAYGPASPHYWLYSRTQPGPDYSGTRYQAHCAGNWGYVISPY